jgi:hypothetical protein
LAQTSPSFRRLCHGQSAGAVQPEQPSFILLPPCIRVDIVEVFTPQPPDFNEPTCEESPLAADVSTFEFISSPMFYLEQIIELATSRGYAMKPT